MRALVTGGTGFVGRAVVEELVRHGHAVRVVSRHRPPAGFPAPGREVEWAPGDVGDAEALRRAAEGCEGLVHLVAIRRQVGGLTHRAVTAEGTANAVAAAREAGVRRLVYVSALGVEGGPETEYFRAKRAAEAAVRGSGIEWVILRPSFIVGPGGFVEEYARLVRRLPFVPVPGGGRYPVQPVALADVARACRLALEKPAAAGRTYDLAGPDRVSFAAFVALIARAAKGRAVPLLPVPLALMFPVAAVLGRLAPARAPATVEELRMLVAGNVGDPGPARDELGLDPTPLEAAVRSAVAALTAVTAVTAGRGSP